MLLTEPTGCALTDRARPGLTPAAAASWTSQLVPTAKDGKTPVRLSFSLFDGITGSPPLSISASQAQGGRRFESLTGASVFFAAVGTRQAGQKQPDLKASQILLLT